jgi:hypothetical protein
MNVFRAALATAAVAVVAAGGGQLPASASTQFAEDSFYICVDQACSMSVSGGITWGQRTADVYGFVINKRPGVMASVHYDAFANSTKIDSTTTYVLDYTQSTLVDFDFNIGNPNLVGGINRIRIQICDSPTHCSVQWNEIRD